MSLPRKVAYSRFGSQQISSYLVRKLVVRYPPKEDVRLWSSQQHSSTISCYQLSSQSVNEELRPRVHGLMLAPNRSVYRSAESAFTYLRLSSTCVHLQSVLLLYLEWLAWIGYRVGWVSQDSLKSCLLARWLFQWGPRTLNRTPRIAHDLGFCVALLFPDVVAYDISLIRLGILGVEGGSEDMLNLLLSLCDVENSYIAYFNLPHRYISCLLHLLQRWW